MSWKTNILGICTILLLAVLTGCSVKTRVKRADKKFAIGEYYDAQEIYKGVYSRISPKKDRSLKAHVAFRQGECNRILNSSRATNNYKAAIRYHYPDSIVYLRYAQTLQYQGKYTEAEKNYTIYLQNHRDDYVAAGGLYACRKINEWKKQSSRYKVSAAKEFNAKRSSNFAPMFIGADSDALMFTSNRNETKSSNKKVFKRASPVTGAQTFNLYTTRKNSDGKWEEIALPDGLYTAPEETEGDSTAEKSAGNAELGVCTFTGDGKTMYFTYSKPINGQDLGAKIYKSVRAGGEWSEPQEVKLFADSSITVGHPSVNPAGDTLYFVSDAPGGKGGKDIWMAEAEGDQWVNIMPLEGPVNTSGDELYPYIRYDGRLYFASNGHPGYGGLDLFYRKDSAIINMGAPFNSNNDDFGITFEGVTENGFFSSNRGQKKGVDQIYAFTLPELVFLVDGKVTDTDGEAMVEGIIRLVGTDGTNQKVLIRKDGTYRFKLAQGVQYAMLASCRGYLNQKQTLSTIGLKDSKSFTQNFILAPLSKPVTMNNIFYEFGKWELTKTSEEGLNVLVKLLNDNPNITIELAAHTDDVGDSISNKELSDKRAQSVVNYLIKAGIDKDRLTPVGYGKSKPVVADAAIHKANLFIPVGQVLDEQFIKKLESKSQQEVCRQINRRTEFKVLKTTYKLY